MAPYWHWRQIESAKAMNENTTNRIALPEKGALSGLYLKLRSTNLVSNYAYDDGWPLQKTTLKVIGNGNVEIMNLRGRQLQAINWWDKGEMPKDVLNDDIGYIMEQYAFVPFGRYLGDPKYGLILDDWKTGIEFVDENTWDITKITDGECKYDIWGLFRKNPEGGLFSGGFLSKKQVVNRDCATATQHPEKLPTDNKLRQIYLFDEPDLSSTPSTTPFSLLTKLWLGIKSKDEYILNNVDATVFARTMHELYGRKAHIGGVSKVHASNANYFDTMIYEREGTHLTPMGTTAGLAAIENSSTFYERIARIYAYVCTSSAGANVYVYCDAWGILYQGLIPLLMQDPMSDQDQWLDAKADGDVYVEFTEGNALGNIYIVLDELQKPPLA